MIIQIIWSLRPALVVLVLALVFFGAMKCHFIEHGQTVSKTDWAVSALVLISMIEMMINQQVLLLPAVLLYALGTKAICEKYASDEFKLFLPLLLLASSPFIRLFDWGLWTALFMLAASGAYYCVADCIHSRFTKKKLAFTALMLLMMAGMAACGLLTVTGIWGEFLFICAMFIISAILGVALGVAYKFYARLRLGFRIACTVVTLVLFAAVQYVLNVVGMMMV